MKFEVIERTHIKFASIFCYYDYIKLNENTVDDKFPIPNLNGIKDKLGKSQHFTTLDLAKGFHQILVRKEDRKKTAFLRLLGITNSYVYDPA